MQLPVYNLVTSIESRLRRSQIKSLYNDDMQAEFASIKEHLPDACSSVLDIGCGVAGIDVLIDRHYAGQDPDIYLLDKTQVERNVFYLFNERAAFYNSLEVAKSVLILNGIPDGRIRLREADAANQIQVPGGIDLIISLLSWGFHYPVETYAKRVAEAVSDSGVVILDVRKGTTGLQTLKHVFESVDIILDTGKYVRVATTRPFSDQFK